MNPESLKTAFLLAALAAFFGRGGGDPDAVEARPGRVVASSMTIVDGSGRSVIRLAAPDRARGTMTFLDAGGTERLVMGQIVQDFLPKFPETEWSSPRISFIGPEGETSMTVGIDGVGEALFDLDGQNSWAALGALEGGARLALIGLAGERERSTGAFHADAAAPITSLAIHHTAGSNLSYEITADDASLAVESQGRR
ncbi:MAG: hypothetical protein R3F20_09045 [Planctomycetota bacterium]